MTKQELLKQLKEFSEKALEGFLLPVRQQKEDTEPPKPRPPDVYMMRLTKSESAQKVAPYIIHRIITGRDAQAPGEHETDASAMVRSIFCVYNEDEQEGGLALLGLMERFRIDLLEKVVIGKRFQIDLEAGLDTIIYPDDTGSYCIGEMISTWIMPGVSRQIYNERKELSWQKQ